MKSLILLILCGALFLCTGCTEEFTRNAWLAFGEGLTRTPTATIICTSHYNRRGGSTICTAY